MKRGIVLLAVFCLMFVSCSNTTTFPADSYQPSTVRNQQTIERPVINKTAYSDSENEQESVNEPERESIPVPQLSTPIEEYRLQVGYGVHMLDRKLGTYAKVLTKYEFPELLKSRNIQSRIDPVGSSYEQFLRVLGGEVVLSSDEEGRLGNFLFYEDEEPMFEYEFHLAQGTFLDYIDSEIEMLGNKYMIIDTTKQEVILKHVETGDEFIIGGGHVMFNGETLADTDSRMTGDAFFVISKADAHRTGDDIYIRENESLQDHLDEPTILTDRLDISYKGLLNPPAINYNFRNRGDELYLEVNSPFRQSEIPLAYSEGAAFRLGDEEGKLHVKEGENKEDYKITEEDYFLLTNTRIGDTLLYQRHRKENRERVSMIFQYKGHSPDENKIEIASKEGFALEVFYNGTSGNREGRIPFAGREFKFAISEEGDLAVDLNGDGRISGAIVDYVTIDGTVDLPSEEVFSSPANITLKFLNYGDQGMKREEATFEIRREDEFVIKPYTELEIYSIANFGDASFSSFGTEYYYEHDEGEGYEEIRVNHPLAPRLAEVVVEYVS